MDIKALRLQREETLIIGIIGIELSAVQLQNARADRIEKVAVVRDHEKRAAKVL